MQKTIVIAGALAQKPGVAGHTWVYLQYLLGFKRLGWDVLFLDRLEPEMCRDAQGQPCAPQQSENLRYLQNVMTRHELGDAYAVSTGGGDHWFGLSRAKVQERLRQSAFLLNIMGYLNDEQLLAAAPRRVFLDIDPGIGQMWCSLGWADVFRGHDNFVTIGEKIGQANCPIPTCGLDWITWHQPVVLEHWPRVVNDSRAFTSIATWRGTYAPIEFEGKRYGQRVHEFRRFVSLPQLSGRQFDLALDIHPDDREDLTLLQENGWTLHSPQSVACDPWVYRNFIQQSGAEFSIAKGIVVDTQCGWFSDRSICYLASGKPVIVQDTGLKDLYPTGEGLITFSNLDEAAAGVEAVASNYNRHARAAREIANEYFDSDKVLRELLVKLGVE